MKLEEREVSTFTKQYELTKSGKKKIEIIDEDEYFFSFFDSFPVNPGHALVVPRRQVESVFELTQDEWNNLKVSLDKTSELLKKWDLVNFYQQCVDEEVNAAADNSFMAKRNKYSKNSLDILLNAHTKQIRDFNIGINEGPNAGRTINHLHIHIIPRFVGDAPDSRFGVRMIFPDFANYKD